MSVYGTLQVGRLVLTEDPEASESAPTSGRTLALKGQEVSVIVGGLDVLDGGTP